MSESPQLFESVKRGGKWINVMELGDKMVDFDEDDIVREKQEEKEEAEEIDIDSAKDEDVDICEANALESNNKSKKALEANSYGKKYEIEMNVNKNVLYGYVRCRFSPNGDYIAAVDTYGSLCVWDVHTGECIQFVQNAHSRCINDICWHFSSKYMYTVSCDGSVKIFGLFHASRFCTSVVSPLYQQNIYNGENSNKREKKSFTRSKRFNPPVPLIYIENAHKGGAFCVCASRINFGGENFYTGGYDKFIKKWDLRSAAKPYLKTKAHKNVISSLDICSDSKALLSTSYDGNIRLLGTRNLDIIKSFISRDNELWTHACFSLNDKYILAINNTFKKVYSSTDYSSCFGGESDYYEQDILTATKNNNNHKNSCYLGRILPIYSINNNKIFSTSCFASSSSSSISHFDEFKQHKDDFLLDGDCIILKSNKCTNTNRSNHDRQNSSNITTFSQSEDNRLDKYDGSRRTSSHEGTSEKEISCSNKAALVDHLGKKNSSNYFNNQFLDQINDTHNNNYYNCCSSNNHNYNSLHHKTKNHTSFIPPFFGSFHRDRTIIPSNDGCIYIFHSVNAFHEFTICNSSLKRDCSSFRKPKYQLPFFSSVDSHPNPNVSVFAATSTFPDSTVKIYLFLANEVCENLDESLEI